jgi:transposase
MFVRQLVVRQGDQTYRYLKVVENVWRDGRTVQRTVVNLGNVAHWPEGKLRKAVCLLSRFLAVELCSLDDVRFCDCRQLGPYLPLARLWQDLRLEAALAQALAHRPIDLPVDAYAQAMVFNRLVEPRSKKAVWEAMEREVQLPGIDGQALSLHGYYRALEYLAAVKNPIERALHARVRHLFNRDLSLVFYDLTSTYFEGDGCSQARHGYSRDHRPDRLQIEIGLLVDAEGIPIGHEVFDGNIKDVRTVLSTLARLRGEFEVRRCIFVSDDGMASGTNLAAIAASGYEYITSIALRKEEVGLRLLSSLPSKSLFEKVAENLWVRRLSPADGVSSERYVGSYNPDRASASRRKRRRRLRACVEFLRRLQAVPRGPGRRRKPERVRPAAEEFLRQKGCEELIRLGSSATGSLTWELDRRALRLEQRRDGLLILRTNSLTLTDQEVALGYRQLWRVEDAFRHIKDLVRLRPIRHWNDLRVLGHVFICVLAYTLERLLEKRLQAADLAVSARGALEELRSVTVATLMIGDQRVRRRSEITARQSELLAAAGVTTVPEIW